MPQDKYQEVSNRFVSIFRPTKETVGFSLRMGRGALVHMSLSVTEWLLLNQLLQKTRIRMEMAAMIRKAEPFHRAIDKSFEDYDPAKKRAYVAYVGSIDLSREIMADHLRLTTCSGERTLYRRADLARIQSTGLGPDFMIERDGVSISMSRSMFESFRDACETYTTKNFPQKKIRA